MIFVLFVTRSLEMTRTIEMMIFLLENPDPLFFSTTTIIYLPFFQGDLGTTSEAEAAKAFKHRMKRKFQRHQLTNRLNFITIVLVFVITVINMFITGFGIKLGENGLDASLIDTFDVASTTATFSADVDNVTAGPFGLDVDVMDLSFSVYSNRSEAG